MNHNRLAATAISLGLASACAPTTNAELPPAPITQEVRVDGLPSALPEEVAKHIGQVVAVEQHAVDGLSELQQIKGSHGSGVRLMDGLFLTAGHVVLDNQGEEYIRGNTCDAIQVQGTTNIDGVSVAVNAQSHIATFANDIASNTPDLAMISAVPNEGLPVEISEVQLSTLPMEPGTRLFTINYQEDEDRNSRSPMLQTLSDESLAKQLDKPAMYGAVLLYKSANGNLVALSGLQGYGPANDKTPREGASGGPVFDEQGGLVGIVVRAGSIEAPRTIRLDEDTELLLEGLKSKRVSIIVIQPTSQETLTGMKVAISHAAQCSEK